MSLVYWARVCTFGRGTRGQPLHESMEQWMGRNAVLRRAEVGVLPGIVALRGPGSDTC